MTVNPAKRRSGLHRKRAQIALATVLIVAQYIGLVTSSAAASASSQLITNTLLGCLVATILGIVFIRGVSRYPGVEAMAYIIPGFAGSYALLILYFLLARLEYSRILLTSSFIVNLVLFIVVYSLLRTRTKLHIGIIPEGRYTSLLDFGGVSWRMLEGPEADVSGLDSIAADLRTDLSDEWERRLAQFALQGLPVYHTKHLRESLTGKVELEHISENSFGTLSPLVTYSAIKQLLDIAAAFVGLIVLSPFLVLIAILIRLDSPGPALFRQVRVGYRGRPFRVFKFRTMTVLEPGAEGQDDALEAAKTKHADTRVTRLGEFLRRNRIDELPQLINVVRGEMSWIGPRPEAEILSRWYEKEIPFYRYRHIVRPGISGWAQVNQGHVAEVDEVNTKLHYDFYYIKHFSPWIDFLIVVKTVRTMLTGFGSR